MCILGYTGFDVFTIPPMGVVFPCARAARHISEVCTQMTAGPHIDLPIDGLPAGDRGLLDAASPDPCEGLSSLEMLLLGLLPTPQSSGPALRSGAICPRCGAEALEYNGLLQLECPGCGFVSGEGAGCT